MTRSTLCKYSWICGCLLYAALLAGCGDSHAAIVKATMLEMNELKSVYEQIKREENVSSQKQNIAPITYRLRTIRDRKQNLTEMSPEEEKAFLNKYGSSLKSIYNHVRLEAGRVRGYKGGGPITYGAAGEEGPMAIIENGLLPKSIVGKK